MYIFLFDVYSIIQIYFWANNRENYFLKKTHPVEVRDSPLQDHREI